MRFCLVTTHHLCNNPRLVKEADTLAAAGHEVRVVWLDARPDLRARDEALTSQRSWRLAPVAAGREGIVGRIRWIRDGVTRTLAARASALGVRARWIAERAVLRHSRALARAAAAWPADVIVAHTIGALPPAARAARSIGARLVFDAEDLHVGELPDDAAHAAERARIATIEAAYLPRCDRLIASAEGIADALARMYGVERPYVVLNAFPLPQVASPPASSTQSPLRLYWYSQVIGGDRGLQSALEAVALLGGRAELYLRGEQRPEFMEPLNRLVASLGIQSLVHLLPLAPPDKLPALAADHDVGLALEIGHTENRALCVSNKLLTYLAAGLAIAASDTPGQRGILRQAEGAGFLFPIGDGRALAAGLRLLADDRARLAKAKAAARRAAEERFSWEREDRRLLEALTVWSDAPRAKAVPAQAGRR